MSMPLTPIAAAPRRPQREAFVLHGRQQRCRLAGRLCARIAGREDATGATDGADYALVWKPPPELLAKLESAKAIFNLGAGVDSLDSIPRSLQAVPLIRLRGAGMAEAH